MKIGTGTYEVIEPGTYPAQMVEWTDVDQFGKPLMSSGYQGAAPKPQWRLKFEIDLGDGEPVTLSKWINKPPDMDNVHPKSKIVELAKAILGDTAETTTWDIPDLMDRPLRVQVDVYEKSDGSQGNGIGKFYPPKAKRQAAPPPDDEDDAPAPTAASGREPAQPIRAREPVGAAQGKAPF